MSKVKRKELLDALQLVKPGLATKEIVEQSTHFVFTGEEIITFNDRIGIIHPFKTDFICSVPADELYKVLDKIAKDEIDLTCNEKHIKIGADRVKAAIAIQSGEKVLASIDALNVDKIKKWQKLPDDFILGVRLCKFSASKDMRDPTLTGVYIDGDAVISSDDLRISQYVLKDDLGESFLIPATTIEELINYEIVDYYIKDGWAIFRTKEGTVFCAQMLINCKYPDVDKFFEFKGVKIELPEGFRNAVETAMVMTEGKTASELMIDVEIEKDSIKCKGENERGWIENDLAVKLDVKQKICFQINPDFLLLILDHTNKIKYGDDKVLFSAKNFLHLIAVKPIE